MLPTTGCKADTATPAPGGEPVAQLMENPGFPHGGSNDRRPSASRIRRMTTTIVTADAIAEENASAPTVLAVETIPAVEIVPMESLPPSPLVGP